jgi:uncharacterized protein YceH (UPF0502 family)
MRGQAKRHAAARHLLVRRQLRAADAYAAQLMERVAELEAEVAELRARRVTLGRFPAPERPDTHHLDGTRRGL